MDVRDFDRTMTAFKQRSPFLPFTVTLVNGNRIAIDRSDVFIVRDGVAAFVGHGGIPVIFDHEGVNRIIGDLSEQSGE